MDATLEDARRELETIRSLMERARHYRHLPPLAPLLGGLLALGGGAWTHLRLPEGPTGGSVPEFAPLWGGIFVVSLAAQLLLSHRAARQAGSSLWSPLAAEIVHALWSPLLVALCLTVALVRSGVPDLVPALWMLCYGVAGVTAGAYARPAVRTLGVAFLLAGVIDLLVDISPGIALGATFGVFHLVYGTVLYLRPARG